MPPRIVVLVGMSGVGKSFQASRLASRCGALVLDCDAEISLRLREVARRRIGESPVTALGRWMGRPGAEGYGEREARYLALEEEVTRGAIDRALTERARVLVDTTGSVVHLREAVLHGLRGVGRVVHLRASPDDHALMLERYLAEPKPVVFGAAWQPGGQGALARSYAALLGWRDVQYQALAHDTIDAQDLDGHGTRLAEHLGW